MTDIVSRLRDLDAGALSDAIDKIGAGHVITALRPLSARTRVAGRAMTVLLGRPSTEAPARHLCTAAVEAGGHDDVILVAHQGRTDCAGWGGILSRAASVRGISGTIVDGAVRDVDEAAEIGYPVYARSSTPQTARGRTQELAWDQPIEFCGITVSPGDYLLADSSGVVIIPASDVENVLEAAEAIATREVEMSAAVGRGIPVSQVMNGDYERLLQGPS